MPRPAAIPDLRYYLFRLLLQVCAWLPLAVLHRIGGLWAALLMVLPNRSRRTTAVNLALCFSDLSEAECRALCRRSLYHTACAALEMGRVWLWPAERAFGLVTEVEGGALLQRALADGDGVIVLTPHLGNWELFGLYLSRLSQSSRPSRSRSQCLSSKDAAVTYLYQPPRNEALHRLLVQSRSRSGIALAPADRRGVAMLMKALGRGDIAGVLPDQVPTRSGGLHADFFAHPALSMTLVSRLLQGRRAKVLCGFAERLPKAAGFRIRLFEADPQIHSPDLQKSVTALNRSIEHCVHQALPQYQWEYKRFRKPPPGGANVY